MATMWKLKATKYFLDSLIETLLGDSFGKKKQTKDSLLFSWHLTHPISHIHLRALLCFEVIAAVKKMTTKIIPVKKNKKIHIPRRIEGPRPSMSLVVMTNMTK